MQAPDEQDGTTPTVPKQRGSWPTFGQVAMVISLVGLAGLSFLAGAAAMHYRAPIARPLSDGFIGADTWFDDSFRPAEVPTRRAQIHLARDEATLTSDGYTLWHNSDSGEATLYDMRLNPVQTWTITVAMARRVSQPGKRLNWAWCHPYPNGDLLGMCASGDGPYGRGLVRLDRRSKVIWVRTGAYHHDFDVAEDGRIYALSRRQMDRLPEGIRSLSEPYTDDLLAILSPQGEPIDEFSLLEAFKGTPFLATLLSGDLSAPRGKTAPAGATQVIQTMRDTPELLPLPRNVGEHVKKSKDGAISLSPVAERTAGMDVLHANGVRVLSKAMAGKFPLFKAGHVLVSFRTPSLIAVIDPQKRTVVWAARGPWKHQHDAQFLDNGHILIYDNLGSARGARVLEYDPTTQAVPWAFPDGDAEPMPAPERGRCQRLPNGNTIAVEPLRRAVEVTPAGRIVWEAGFDSKDINPYRNIMGVTRHRPEDLPFLKGATSRPK